MIRPPCTCGLPWEDNAHALQWPTLAPYAGGHFYEPSTLDPVSPTVGATDSPREDSTDVDQLAQLRAQLSSTRTALQRVREAMPHDFFTHKANWRDALDKLMCMTQDADEKAYWRHELAAFDNAYAELRALTSTETDQ